MFISSWSPTTRLMVAESNYHSWTSSAVAGWRSSRARFNEATSNPGIPKNSTDIYDDIYNFSNPRTTQHVQQLANDDIIQLETFNVSNSDDDFIHEHVSIGNFKIIRMPQKM